jgi:hypothetical protein
MAKNKTIQTDNSVKDYLNGIADEKRQKDCYAIDGMFQKVTGLKPKMWGPSIVGYGSYHYVYDSGHEGDAPLVGFSSRADAITLYVISDFDGKEEALKKLGKHKVGKGCLYIKKLADVDEAVLEKIIRKSFEYMSKKHLKSK